MGLDTVSTSTAFQLEEARRRLEDESRRYFILFITRKNLVKSIVLHLTVLRLRRYSQHPSQPPPTATSQPTQMPSLSVQYPSTTSTLRTQDSTIAVYTFCDEDLPYRSKLPGTQPTLKQFKDYLPKKGSFR